MIIFGWGKGRSKDHGAAVPVVCPQCHNQTFYRYFSVTRWFSLFFIPLIPYSTKHFLVCPICTRAVPLDASGRERATQMVELTASYQGGSMSQEKYLAEIRGLGPQGVQPSLDAAGSPPELPAPPARPDGYGPPS